MAAIASRRFLLIYWHPDSNLSSPSQCQDALICVLIILTLLIWSATCICMVMQRTQRMETMYWTAWKSVHFLLSQQPLPIFFYFPDESLTGALSATPAAAALCYANIVRSKLTLASMPGMCWSNLAFCINMLLIWYKTDILIAWT